MDIQEEKKILRKYIKQLKANISVEEKQQQSKFIIKTIEDSIEFRNSKIVMAYWALNDEVSLNDLIIKWHNQKTILLPCVIDEILVIRQFIGIDSMKIGSNYSILEPTGPIFNEIEKIDLILVPGIAFDINNNRMGRGKAYYDRFLTQTKAIKAGICFNFQLFDKVPYDDFDVKMDTVYTVYN